MAKQTFELRDFKPGLVTDVSANSNTGLLDVSNFTINYLGKLVKRKGWETITSYGTKYPTIDNLDLPYTGERPDILYVNATIEDGVTYRDVVLLYSKPVQLVVRRYDENGNFVLEKEIADSVNWFNSYKKNGPVTFIPTNDLIYIINGYRGSGETGTVFKYNFGINNKALDADKLQNISLQEITEHTAGLNWGDAGPNIKLTSEASYFYKIAPVYVTSSEGKAAPVSNAGIFTGAQYTYKDMNGNVQSNPYKPPIKVDIKIKPTYDPYITAYKIYRTKGITSISPGITPGYVSNEQAEDFDYYFLAQVDAPENVTDPSAWITLYTDRIRDIELGSVFTQTNPLNNYKHDLAPNLSVLPATKTQDGIGMKATTGVYQSNTLVLAGNYDQSDKIYVSEFDKTDTFVAEKVYRAPLLNKNNPATAILGVGQNIFIFGKSTLYALKPTASEDVPYSLELVSTHLGVEGPTAVTTLREQGYFIFNGVLYTISSYGEVQPLSQSFNKELAKFTRAEGSSMPSDIILRSNSKDRSILMIIFRKDAPPINLWLYPEKGFVSRESGYRDIYERTGEMHGPKEKVIPLSKDDRYALVSYQYNSDLDEEWGVTYDGDLVRRRGDYTDYSDIQEHTSWPGYINQQITVNVKGYAVEGIIEKAWSFPAMTLINSVTIYGDDYLRIKATYDDQPYPDQWLLVKADPQGTEIPLNGYGRIFKFKFKHDANVDINIDYFKFKVDAPRKLHMSEYTSGGV